MKKEVHTANSSVRGIGAPPCGGSFRGNEPSTALYLFPFVARTFRFAIDEKRLVKGFEKYTSIHADKKTFYSIQRKEAGPHIVLVRALQAMPEHSRGLATLFRGSKGCTRIGL